VEGPILFSKLSHQSSLASVTTFNAVTPEGDRVVPFGRSIALPGSFRFSIDFPKNPFSRGPLFSTSEDNPGGASQLLVLRGQRGGTWVDEGDNTGHWEGGVDTGEYLLCWEDWVHGDGDFQDLVISAKGIEPVE